MDLRRQYLTLLEPDSPDCSGDDGPRSAVYVTQRFTERIMNKNDFVFCCITGLPMAGREAGAENDGWKTRPSLDEAVGYHDALESGDLGPGPQSELAKCSGSFDSETVAAMLDEAKRELVDARECQ